MGFSKDTDGRTSLHLSRTEKSISLVLTFKYYLKYKAQSEAKYLVIGLSVTKDRALFTTWYLTVVDRHTNGKVRQSKVIRDEDFNTGNVNL